MTLYNHPTRFISLLLASFMGLVGCSTDTVRPQQIVVQESLLKPCPDELPYSYGTDGKSWLLMGGEWSRQYHECRIRHNNLVDFIKQYNSGGGDGG